MDFVNPVTVFIPREFAPVMVDRLVPPDATAQRVVPVPVVSGQRRSRHRGWQDRGVDQLCRPDPTTPCGRFRRGGMPVNEWRGDLIRKGLVRADHLICYMSHD